MSSVPRPKNRRLYMFGLVSTGIGLLLVLPVIIALVPGLGNRAAFVLQAGSVVQLLCGIGGLVLIVTGFGLMAAGSPGLGEAISKEVDELFEMGTPEAQRRAEYEVPSPTAEADGSSAANGSPEVRILIRCRDCRTLNPEQEKHCLTCGAEL